MKKALLSLILLLCMTPGVFAEGQATRLTLTGETLEHGEAATLALSGGSDVFYGGLSLSHIHSSRIIQHSQRRTIYPMYVFFGFKAPWKVSPFIEGGFDLGDALINDLYGNDDDEDVDLVDYYLSGGLVFQLNKTTSLLLYAKRYTFKFREFISAPTEKERPESYGLGMSFHF